MKRIILILAVALMPVALYSEGDSTSVNDVDQEVQHSSSAKSDDDKKERIMKQYTLSKDYTQEVLLPFDTLFLLSHRFKFADKFSPFNAEMGNYGLPSYQINFFDRITDPDKYLYSTYYPFMHVTDNPIFMNTQVPFTELVWSYGEPRATSEQTFRLRHTQNVNKNLNFGFIYDIIYDIGQYNYQMAENKTFTFFSSFTGERYSYYFSSGINNIRSEENGGVKQDANALSTYSSAGDVPVSLTSMNDSESMLKNRNMLFVHRYSLGNRGDVSDSTKRRSAANGILTHIFEIENNKRMYTDKMPSSGFYDTTFINSESTFDSLLYRNIKNTLRFDFNTDTTKLVSFGIGVGVRNEIHRYSQIVPVADTVLGDTLTWRHGNNVVIGKLYNNIGDKFKWVVDGELFLTGYRSGDFKLSGEIDKRFIFNKGSAEWNINGGIRNTKPSFWYEQWGGNNLTWKTDLKKEFRIDVGTSFKYPARQLEARFNYAMIDNYYFFGSDAMPAQHEGGLSVASIYAHKNLKFWKFHLDLDLLFQQSSNSSILDLPLFTGRTAFYFEHLFRFASTGGRLHMEIGADATYHTKYRAYSYMPATGRFYNQETVEVGDYPFIDVFVNFKLKRARIFVMLDHLNQGYMGDDYYMIPSYPMNTMMLRYGLAWTFYY